MGNLFLAPREDSVAALDKGATANDVWVRRLDNRNRLLEQHGLLQVSVNQSKARFRFGDGRQGEVRHAADETVVIAGTQGAFTASALNADIPASLCEGAINALGGQFGFSRDLLVSRSIGVPIPLRVTRMGHYVLSAFDFGKDPSGRARDPVNSASFFEIIRKNPDLSRRRIQFPYAEDGSCDFRPPLTFSACKAATLRDSRGRRRRTPRRLL